MGLLQLVEEHQGLFAILAFIGAMTLAYVEFRRAEAAEAARVLEPAEAAASLLENMAMELRLGQKNSYWAIHAIDAIERSKTPIRQLAESATASGSLILVLHEAAELIERIARDRFPSEPQLRQRACANYLSDVEKLRRQVAAIVSRFHPFIRSDFMRRRIKERYGI